MMIAKTRFVNQLAAGSAGMSELFYEIERNINTYVQGIGALLPYLTSHQDQIISAVRALLSSGLSRFTTDSEYTPQRLRGADICVVETGDIQVNIGAIDEKAASNPNLFSLPSDLILMNLGGESFSVILHEIPDGCDITVFDQTQSLGLGAEVEMGRGKAILIPADRYVPEFRISQPAIVLKIFSIRQHALGWVYNKESLKPLFASSSSNEASRLQVASRLLAMWAKEFGANQASIEILKNIASHQAHFVRWTAIQCLFEVAPDIGKEFLRHALSDQHLHIRRAANSSWARLYGNEKAN
jgi:hypothetical protein